jgi:hypothetical protein
MDKESSMIMMVLYMRGVSRTMKGMAMVFIKVLMATVILGSTKMARNVGKASIHFQVGNHMKDILRMVIIMDKVF